MALACFKAYDIRGRLDAELNDDIAYRLGRALVQHLGARRVVLGADVRPSSEALKAALQRGICDSGADVVDIGLAGTEEVYFAAMHLDVDAGVEVTASHNPMDYNGMKLVRRHALPISADTGLKDLEALVERNQFAAPTVRGSVQRADIVPAYVERLLQFVDV
ncbi:MAG: phosphomannomutase CpsG, partial [Betaproteobacteria bacterium]|nr:phosphomannomutase CpsG [Betaproteobacteria bacterium]